jgi:hypothetical protein
MGLLTLPLQGLFGVFKEIAELAEQELFNEDAVAAELKDLYLELEAGTLSEEEFGRREAGLVQRLEEIKKRRRRGSGRGRR